MSKPLILSSFIKNPRNTSYEGKDQDEEVKILVRQSLISVWGWVITSVFLFFIPIFAIPALSRIQYGGEEIFTGMFLFSITIFWYIFVFGYIFQNFLDWYFEVLLVTNKKIVDIDRGCTNISETLLSNIQDITSKMNATLGQILNIGSIYIQTAAEREEFEFHLVDNPSIIRDAISDLVSNESHKKTWS